MKLDPAALKQRQEIEAVRKLLQPEKVRDGHIPGWLSKRVTRYCRQHDIETYGCKQMALRYALNHAAHVAGVADASSTVLDHWGTIKARHYRCCCAAESVFVSEPYGFGMASALTLEAFCKALDLDWHLTPNAWHYPGSTIRVLIHEKQE